MPLVTCPACRGVYAVDDYCEQCDNLGEVHKLDRSGKWRGRFYIERDGDGYWQLVDELEGMTLGFDTKAEAEDAAKFAREYVKRWRSIDFNSFPYNLDAGPVEENPSQGIRGVWVESTNSHGYPTRVLLDDPDMSEDELVELLEAKTGSQVNGVTWDRDYEDDPDEPGADIEWVIDLDLAGLGARNPVQKSQYDDPEVTAESIGRDNALECIDQIYDPDDSLCNVQETAHEYGVDIDEATNVFVQLLEERKYPMPWPKNDKESFFNARERFKKQIAKLRRRRERD